MGRHRKNRTHLKGGVASNPAAAEGVPKSFVIKHGQVGTSLTQLVRDMRRVMEPYTASRLKERTRNKLKDFFTMAPALGVTHLLAFTLTDVAPSLRIVRLSAGPTLSFRIERYSLVKDVLNSSKRARNIGSVEYLTPPLPGPGTPPHLPLLMKTFQTLFPPLSPQKLSLSSARRIVLISYNADRGTVDFRHYLITVKPYGVSKRVRRVLEGATTKVSASKGYLDLGNEKDVADFFLRKKGEPGPSSDGYESAASSASSAGGRRRGRHLAGGRLPRALIKITEGLPGKEGSVIYHEFVKKTKAEATAQKAEHVAKEKLRQQRREEQERNVKRKKAEADGKKAGSDSAEQEEGEEDDGALNDEELEDDGVWDDEEEYSGGEEDENASGSDEEESSEDEGPRPPLKKPKRGKR
ncbi:hypothetical protein EVJ58_g4984 [Rhodofomes roseus]|uniref:Brix domain-containing protein n=1 Tax=Rhodofomes roseus TaxID=34475 RepID=A0A4Y9YGK7_9APHY|nr:hypothetical protein EVJ58_g4984 [Rhodofomes roseus]